MCVCVDSKQVKSITNIFLWYLILELAQNRTVIKSADKRADTTEQIDEFICLQTNVIAHEVMLFN